MTPRISGSPIKGQRNAKTNIKSLNKPVNTHGQNTNSETKNQQHIASNITLGMAHETSQS